MASDWIRFTSQQGQFSVLMPGPNVPKDEGKTETDAKNPAASPFTSHLFTQTSENGVIYLLGWVDYPPGFKPNAQAEIAANRDNFLKGIEAKLGFERAIALGGNPGIEFTAARDKDGMAVISRVYMVGARPYMLAAVTPKGKDDSKNIERFFASFTLNTAASNWVTLSPVAGKFSVLMPGPEVPSEKVETTTGPKNTAASPYTTHLFIQKSQNNVTFLLGWVDYPPAFKPPPGAELAANRDNFVKGIKATVFSEKAITLGANPGIEFTAIRESDGATIKARVYMVGARPYMLVAITPKGKDDSTNIEKFFASFTLK